jgi:hypothetical protein
MKLCPYTGKHQLTEKEARAELRKMRKSPNAKCNLRGLNVYRCGCKAWHVGHKPQKPRQEEAVPQPKPLTEGQARRKAEHERKKAERHVQRAKLFEDYAENLRYCDILLARELLMTARSH